MIYPKIELAQSVIEILLAHDITHIVISPGSRNAPLTIGFANNPNFKCFSIVDERCAAFFALGMAQQIGKPVAVVCTSGSALLNYYPAFAEAFYSQIPFIVLSADRPQSKIDIGDGQTIRQENVFENHSLYNANLTEIASEENDIKINEAILKAINNSGPVHINIPFEEPLYETTSELNVIPEILINPTPTSVFNLEQKFSDLWHSKTKKLIIIGGQNPNSLENATIELFANDPSVVVLTEVTSNCYHINFITSIDTLITNFKGIDKEEFEPEIVLSFGGMIVSKRIKQLLRNYPKLIHWHVDPLRAYDTFGCLQEHFITSPNSFLKSLYSINPILSSTYLSQHLNIIQKKKDQLKSFFKTIPFSDLKAFEYLFKNLPENINLQIGNSASIRYAQLFEIKPNISVFCNRGTSGIDGSTSTAIGAAVLSPKPTIFITGDVSFFYDSNALWNSYIPKDFKIIVINNGGGGIFRILPGHQENPVFSNYFETQHQLNASHLCKMYQLNYFTASNEAELVVNFNTFLQQSDSPSLLEIHTPTLVNNKVLEDYFSTIQ